MPEVPFTPLFLAVKLADIGLVTTYYFMIGLGFAKLFDSLYGKFNAKNYDEVSNFRLFAEIVAHLFLLGIVAYVLRNIIEAIPFPLEGVAGFRHERLKEIEGGHVLAIVLIMFQKNLLEKIQFFAGRAFGMQISTGGEGFKGAKA